MLAHRSADARWSLADFPVRRNRQVGQSDSAVYGARIAHRLRTCVKFFCSTQQLSFFLRARERETAICFSLHQPRTRSFRNPESLSGWISAPGEAQTAADALEPGLGGRLQRVG